MGRKAAPAKASHASAMLQQSGTGFIGFGAFASPSSSSQAPAGSTVPDTSSSFITATLNEKDMDPELQITFKRLAKKDATTKLKALGEMSTTVSGLTPDKIHELIPYWVPHYRRLARDTDYRVRRDCHVVMKAVTSVDKKALAPHLKQLMGIWICNMVDPVKEVSQTSVTAFENAIAKPKHKDAFWFCHKEILQALKLNLAETKHSLHSTEEPGLSSSDVDDIYERVISSSLLGLKTFVDILPREQWFTALEERGLLSHNILSKFMKSDHALIRSALNQFLAKVITNHEGGASATPFPESDMQAWSRSILGTIGEKHASAQQSVWDLVLRMLRAHPTAWHSVDANKAVFPRLFDLLASGCGGSTIPYAPMLPFLDLCETQVLTTNLANKLFDAFLNGLSPEFLPVSSVNTAFQSFWECLLLLSKKLVNVQESNAPFPRTSLCRGIERLCTFLCIPGRLSALASAVECSKYAAKIVELYHGKGDVELQRGVCDQILRSFETAMTDPKSKVECLKPVLDITRPLFAGDSVDKLVLSNSDKRGTARFVGLLEAIVDICGEHLFADAPTQDVVDIRSRVEAFVCQCIASPSVEAKQARDLLRFGSKLLLQESGKKSPWQLVVERKLSEGPTPTTCALLIPLLAHVEGLETLIQGEPFVSYIQTVNETICKEGGDSAYVEFIAAALSRDSLKMSLRVLQSMSQRWMDALHDSAGAGAGAGVSITDVAKFLEMVFALPKQAASIKQSICNRIFELASLESTTSAEVEGVWEAAEAWTKDTSTNELPTHSADFVLQQTQMVSTMVKDGNIFDIRWHFVVKAIVQVGGADTVSALLKETVLSDETWLNALAKDNESAAGDLASTILELTTVSDVSWSDQLTQSGIAGVRISVLLFCTKADMTIPAHTRDVVDRLLEVWVYPCVAKASDWSSESFKCWTSLLRGDGVAQAQHSLSQMRRTFAVGVLVEGYSNFLRVALASKTKSTLDRATEFVTEALSTDFDGEDKEGSLEFVCSSLSVCLPILKVLIAKKGSSLGDELASKLKMSMQHVTEKRHSCDSHALVLGTVWNCLPQWSSVACAGEMLECLRSSKDASLSQSSSISDHDTARTVHRANALLITACARVSAKDAADVLGSDYMKLFRLWINFAQKDDDINVLVNSLASVEAFHSQLSSSDVDEMISTLYHSLLQAHDHSRTLFMRPIASALNVLVRKWGTSSIADCGNHEQLYPLLMDEVPETQMVAFVILIALVREVEERECVIGSTKQPMDGEFEDEMQWTLPSSFESALCTHFEAGEYEVSTLWGFLATWTLLLESYTHGDPGLRQDITLFLRASKAYVHFLGVIWNTLPEGSFASSAFKTAARFVVEDHPIAIETIGPYSAKLYLSCLATIPTFGREWWSDCKRVLSTDIESYTKRHVSPLLIVKEFEVVEESDFDVENLTVKGKANVREVAATYQKDDARLEIIITIPEAYPLRHVEVGCDKRVGISEQKWRKWQMQMMTLLNKRDGSVLDTILMWKKNVDREFEGVEECPICYAIVHLTDRTLPKLSCKTCKNKFHAACLYKWFSTSHKSNCPLCQTPIS